MKTIRYSLIITLFFAFAGATANAQQSSTTGNNQATVQEKNDELAERLRLRQEASQEQTTVEEEPVNKANPHNLRPKEPRKNLLDNTSKTAPRAEVQAKSATKSNGNDLPWANEEEKAEWIKNNPEAYKKLQKK